MNNGLFSRPMKESPSLTSISLSIYITICILNYSDEILSHNTYQLRANNIFTDGIIAQLGERTTEDRNVTGSIPVDPNFFCYSSSFEQYLLLISGVVLDYGLPLI